MIKNKTILLVDDDPDLLRLLSIRLRSNGYEVETAQSGKEALGKACARKVDLVITDLRMDGMDGVQLFDRLRQRFASLPVIILTAHGTIPDAVEATRKGIFGYLTKPFDSVGLLSCVRDAIEHGTPTVSRAAPTAESDWRREIVGESAVMRHLLEEAAQVAVSDVSVLLQSQSGTGKELLAKAIHQASDRRDGPFVPVNCGAIPEPLLESELFGHQKGAFTGAIQNHLGLFRVANTGTLFLDEIGDMPLEFQTKLLRVLQEKEVRAVGARNAEPIDVRIISATHRDLDEAVAEGTFREDLYYRLNVVMLEVPALADRREDIPLLANQFLANARARLKKPCGGFSKEAMEMLLTAPWPGNVRQLRNIVEQVAVFATTPLIPTSLVQRALRGRTGEIVPLAEAQNQFERDYLVRIMQVSHGNVAKAARLAKRNRTEFYKLLSRHHLDPSLFRERST